MFLLGAAPMSLTGCPGEETNDTLTTLTGASATMSTTPTTETGDGDGDPGDGDGAPGDGDGAPGDGDGDGASGDGDGTPGDGDGDGTPGDGDGDNYDGYALCVDYAALYGMCLGDGYEAIGLTYCLDSLDYAASFGPACLHAYELYLVCVSQVDCEALAMDPPPGCEDALDAVTNNCE